MTSIPTDKKWEQWQLVHFVVLLKPASKVLPALNSDEFGNLLAMFCEFICMHCFLSGTGDLTLYLPRQVPFELNSQA